MSKKRVVIAILAILVLSLGVRGSCTLNPCTNYEQDKCYVLPNFNFFSYENAEICVVAEDGGVDCFKIQR